MANDIRILENKRVGEDFIPSRYLPPGENEYYLRDEQLRTLSKEPSSFRPLSANELEILVRNNNTCRDWSLFLVQDPFHPELVRNNIFFGLIRISRLEPATLEHHDFSTATGIFNSLVIACDIGDNCAISDCAYLSHYIIDDHCILINNAELQVSNHTKFGNGVVMESEEESVRITLDVMNENGGRAIYPFNGMLPGDAWLWAKFRDRPRLMERFAQMTDSKFDRRLGRYGIIGRESVLKHNRIIKDTYIGQCAYIKGSNKLKNLTINSSSEAPTQIGEGVELVNGILGYGCHVFYGCKAVRFVMCDNSALKYGARLIHSVLGENSTVSCCEILNNLIFPAHEQHHNTSFLIASLIKGQSNLAAGATIGSNHNSRAPDGEIEAGRGFWPGLCTSVKHSSRFASFCLLSKSDYKYELDIPFPFSLIDNDETHGRLIVAPGWWWYANTYALMRNEKKFRERDKRIDKSIQFLYSPFAPDTVTEILIGLGLLERATGLAALSSLEDNVENRKLFDKRVFELIRELRDSPSEKPSGKTSEQDKKALIRQDQQRQLYELGAHILANHRDPLPFEVAMTGIENSHRPQVVLKPGKAWKSYREMLLWFSVQIILPALEGAIDAGTSSKCLCDALNERYLSGQKGGQYFSEEGGSEHCSEQGCSQDYSEQRGSAEPFEIQWENLGGFLVRHTKLEGLLQRVEQGSIKNWEELHDKYRALSEEYEEDARAFAWCILGYLSMDIEKEADIDAKLSVRSDVLSAPWASHCSTRSETSSAPIDRATPWPQLNQASLISLLQAFQNLSSEIAARVYATRAKDWENPFRKATFRNEAEQLAVHGRAEDNADIKAFARESEALRDRVGQCIA